MDTGDILDAVKTRRVVELRYVGPHGPVTRIVHPHGVYRTSTEKPCNFARMGSRSLETPPLGTVPVQGV